MKKNMYTSKQPLVSVVMPVYNAERYLRAALDSVFTQTYRNIEVICVDDASTDSSPAILAEYKALYPRILRVVRMKKNQNKGGDVCANEGLKRAKGVYICRMDADDVCHPDRIEKQVAFLNKHRNYFLVGTNAHVIDADGLVVGEKTEPTTHAQIYRSYFTFHPLIHPSCMYRRVYRGKKFQYEIGYSANNDYYTFFTLLCKGYKYANLKEKLMYYRIHGKNDTFNNIKAKFANTIKIRIQMVIQYGYKPSVKQVVVTLIQTGVTMILPEKAIATLYFLVKGIIKFKNPLTQARSLMKIDRLAIMR